MIAYIKGEITSCLPAQAIIEVNGLGYDIQISLYTYTAIRELKKGKLYTYLQIKEDGHSLFGFFEEIEKNIFLQLISVSGIGASTARVILSALPPDEIRNAIIQEKEKLLESIKGIGAKTAKRIILELKDKMIKLDAKQENSSSLNNTIQEEALNALMALGISRTAGEAALSKAQKQDPFEGKLEDLIKKALKSM